MKIKSIARWFTPLVWLYKGFRLQLNYLRFLWEFRKFRTLSAPKTDKRFRVSWANRQPVLMEWTSTHGFDRHYVYHPAWAARIVARNRPAYHVDISSTLHFCSILSAFVPVRYYEFRAVDLGLSNLSCADGNLLALPFSDASVPSLSCLHVVEHVGLGRYGDPLRADGDQKAASELSRVLAVDGALLFVVPVGRPRVAFNAHRIYSYEQVLDLFPRLQLQEFALIPDDPKVGGLISGASPAWPMPSSMVAAVFRLPNRSKSEESSG